eukprot:UN18829
MSYYAEQSVLKVAKHLKCIKDAGGAAKVKLSGVVTEMDGMVIPFGPNLGATKLPFGVFGSWTTSKLKGQDLLAGKIGKP